MKSIVCSIFIIFIGSFFTEYYAQEQDTNALLEEFYKWKITIFTGPGINEGRISSLTVSRGKGAVNKIYALGVAKIQDNPDDMVTYQRSICEFTWNGDFWEKTMTKIGVADPWGMCLSLEYLALREGDSTHRLYYATIGGLIFEYEYSESLQEWILASSINERVHSMLTQAVVVGSRLKNGKKYIYNNLKEFEWAGGTWRKSSSINISDRVGGWLDRVSHISFGNWNEEENCAYYLTSDGKQMTELKWTGNSWQEISKFNTECNQENDAMVSRPFTFVADLGRGLRLYTIGGFGECSGGIIKECVKDNLTWKVNDLVAGEAKAFSITYGKISSKEPMSLYAVVLGGYDKNGALLPDAIREYTFKDKKWRITWNSVLTAEGVKVTERLGGYQILDLCMADGRNDEYNRLYIVDSYGNVWECSIPPRELRPLVDEFGNIIYGPDGKPMYPGGTGGVQIQKNKIIPSILGK